MIRAMQIINANTLTSIIGFSESFIPNSVYTQCIRWKRKPIWLPTAKSKLFRVPKKRVVPVDENEEAKRLYNHYRTYISSLRSYMTQDQNMKEQFDESIIPEIGDFEMCSAINDKWNAEIAKQREIRIANMRQQRKEEILQKVVEYEEKKMQLMETIDEKIRKAKMEAPTFITEENIDAAIEECLANVINHNRALDLEGNWHVGKSLPTSSIEEVQKLSVND